MGEAAEKNPSERLSVSPYLTVKGGKAAIAYYEKVFGAKCSFQMPSEEEGDDRLMHATLLIGNSSIMLSDEFPEFGPDLSPDLERGSPVALSLTLDKASEVDRIYELALAEGGASSSPPEDMFWGDRFCQIYDPFGHRWMLIADKDS